MSDRDRAQLRLGVVLSAFPLLFAFGLRTIPVVDRFFAGSAFAA
ncbi:MAG TPA: hypothetical protein VMV46_06910 [Thermoanaerobaculia bacterium]|nr:hypothetical protein [Thermoanaerobaculia bacterium]